MRTFCSGEPGAENYVDLCLRVWRTGKLPEVVEPDWFEIFGIAQRGAPEKASQEERFVRFKLFCGVVAARFLMADPGSPPPKLAIHLHRHFPVTFHREPRRLEILHKLPILFVATPRHRAQRPQRRLVARFLVDEHIKQIIRIVRLPE